MMFFVFFFFHFFLLSFWSTSAMKRYKSPFHPLSLSRSFPLNKPFFLLLDCYGCGHVPLTQRWCVSQLSHIFPMLQKQWTSLSAKQILGLWEGWLELEGSRGYEPGGEANQAPLLSVDVRAQGIDTFFVTMDYLRGAWLPLPLTCWQYLHQSNIAHRDLKPSNILVTKAGHIKVFFWLILVLGFGKGARK